MTINKGAKITLLLIAVAWLLKSIEWSLGVDLFHFGIYPRNRLGIFGIFFHPFIHGGFKHLFSNTVSFAILCFSLYFFIPKIASKVLRQLTLYTGIMVWLFARPSFHIGASGVIYGIASFLFFIGIFQKNPGSLIISLCIAVLNHGMLVGLVPNEEGISWESHLSGFIVGCVLAYYYRHVETEFSRKKTLEVEDDFSFEGYRNLENKGFKYNYKEKEDSQR
ncbi:rhomboid family intramembrane serine protease [Flammeovirga sp. EKP202]|uniref:rhomboid family intramembrane serine protease n=1 Tax=Flammeovirga sp. EKP202 TaxID=2770592 RepID=UPI00165F690D|nr:rhomboid family intramembrane serine protease [Flammeovirga sp. EKP202]MBD0404204.1 rhomboid family intramembrane serine protease [Flammeovirga sp. EKP202]